MSELNVNLLLLLITVHLAGDFLLQPTRWVEDRFTKRWQSGYLYLHSAIHGLLAAAATMLIVGTLLSSAILFFWIAITHLGMDLWKSHKPANSARWFVVDQLVHLTAIIVAWLCLINWKPQSWNIAKMIEPEWLVIFIAYFMVLKPFSILIGQICKQWADQIDAGDSLANAGAWIGYLERLLILTFILINQFGAIGFLLAAKSVLRFGDIKENDHRKINEYILLGTLTSFSMTIALGLIAKQLIAMAQAAH